jgi:hypothetical protein
MLDLRELYQCNSSNPTLVTGPPFPQFFVLAADPGNGYDLDSNPTNALKGR